MTNDNNPPYPYVIIGGVWNKEGYFSGQINLEKAGLGQGKMNFIIVNNSNMKSDRSPDMIVKMRINTTTNDQE